MRHSRQGLETGSGSFDGRRETASSCSSHCCWNFGGEEGDDGHQVAEPLSVNLGFRRVERAHLQKTGDQDDASEWELGMNPYWLIELSHDVVVEVVLMSG